MSAAQAMTTASQRFRPAYRVRGTTDEMTTCEACGRDDLKSTVIMEALGADGGSDGVTYAGSDCAARMSGYAQKDIKARANRADKERDAKIRQAVDEAGAITARARDEALAAWVTETYGVPARVNGPWAQPGDVPSRTASPYKVGQAWAAAGSPGLDPALNVRVSICAARENAALLPAGTALEAATPQQVIDAIRAGQGAA